MALSLHAAIGSFNWKQNNFKKAEANEKKKNSQISMVVEVVMPNI